MNYPICEIPSHWAAYAAKKLAAYFVPTYGGRVEIGLPCKTSQGVHSNIKDFKGGPKEVQYTLRSTIEH